MTKAGKRILDGVREALAIAKGEQSATSVTVSGHTYVPKEAVMAELRSIQRQTVAVCIDCVESLKTDAQGLSLDPQTIDACATILRNMMTLADQMLPISPRLKSFDDIREEDDEREIPTLAEGRLHVRG